MAGAGVDVWQVEPPSLQTLVQSAVLNGYSRSRANSASQPPLSAEGGSAASSPVAPAVYMYMSAVIFSPSARAASTRRSVSLSTSACGVGTQTTSLPAWPTSGTNVPWRSWAEAPAAAAP